MTNRSVNTIVNARWIVTMDPAQPLLENHCIVIDDGKILALPAQNQHSYQATETVDLVNHVAIPGLINAHGHAPMTLFRGLADDQPLMTWLEHHIWPAESRWAFEDFCWDGARLAIAEMITAGITCFSDMYMFPDQVARGGGQCPYALPDRFSHFRLPH